MVRNRISNRVRHSDTDRFRGGDKICGRWLYYILRRRVLEAALYAMGAERRATVCSITLMAQHMLVQRSCTAEIISPDETSCLRPWRRKPQQ